MVTRRTFLKRTAAAATALVAAPTIIPASALGKNGHVPPSDRINLAFIGAGNQGCNDARSFLNDERVQITTICDVNKKSDGYWDGAVAGRAYPRYPAAVPHRPGQAPSANPPWTERRKTSGSGYWP